MKRVAEGLKFEEIAKSGEFILGQSVSNLPVEFYDASSLSSDLEISSEDVRLFTKVIADALANGLEMVPAVQKAVSEFVLTGMEPVAVSILRKVQNGISFSESIIEYSDIFPEYYIDLIRCGESSGNLKKTILLLPTIMEKRLHLWNGFSFEVMRPFKIVWNFMKRNPLNFASTLFVFLVAFCGYYKIGLYSLCNLIKEFMGSAEHGLGLLLLWLIYTLWEGCHRRSGRKIFDLDVRSVPVWGCVVFNTRLAHGMRVLGAFLENGLSFQESIKMTLMNCPDTATRDVFNKILHYRRHGADVARSFILSRVFPKHYRLIFKTGAENNCLGKMVTMAAESIELQSFPWVDRIAAIWNFIDNAVCGIGGLAVFIGLLALLCSI